MENPETALDIYLKLSIKGGINKTFLLKNYLAMDFPPSFAPKHKWSNLVYPSLAYQFFLHINDPPTITQTLICIVSDPICTSLVLLCTGLPQAKKFTP